MTDRTFTRIVRSLMALLVAVAVLAAAYAVIDGRRRQRAMCEQVNKANAGQIRLWGPVLAAPRVPLKANATAEERRAYDDSTRVREDFQRNLHLYFDPIDC